MNSNPSLPLTDRFPLARGFAIGGGPDAVLLLHGFTGTPAEMRPIANAISKRLGWRVGAPLLPGHGTVEADLTKFTWKDWLETARKMADELQDGSRHLHLVGLSMGAMLAVELLREDPGRFHSVSLLAPALQLRTAFQRFVLRSFQWPALCAVVPHLPKGPPLHPDHVTYGRYPTRALRSFDEIGRRGSSLPTLSKPPALIAYSETDEIVDPSSAEFLKSRFTHPLSRLVRLEKSIHVLTLGEEKEVLFEQLIRFYREVTSPS